MQGAAVILDLEASPDRLIGAEPIGAALFKTSRQDRMRSASAATAEEDDRLLGEIAGGSNQALAQLMERHLGRVFSLALRITGSRSDAEDAAQEVFTRVWRKAAEWTPGDARFSTWLYRVTMNLCIDVRRRPRAEQLDPDLPIADAGPGAEALLIEREQEVQVRAAMNALPERQREAMSLCYTLGLSNAAAAEVMEISLKAYESLLVRAKRDIRARLEGLES
ncbi:MAG: RNA polymerase sigma factor [Rhodospirillaceae bacterium]|nr:RNA polymerase sigma factor [Rhodospirillaceae bacterium]